jgi:predicted HTH transcriptional regulator
LEEYAEPEQTTLRLSMFSLLPATTIAELVKRFGEVYRSLPEVERLALATAQVEGTVTNERLREISGAHPSDLTSLLRGLVTRGFLERHGNRRGAYYKLRAENAEAAPVSLFPGDLDARQRAALDWVRQQGSISNDEYRELAGVSRATASRHLQVLVEKGILIRQGAANATRYVLPAGEPRGEEEP